MKKYSVALIALALGLSVDVKASGIYSADNLGGRHGDLERSNRAKPSAVTLILNTTNESLVEANKIFNKTSYYGMTYSVDTDSYKQLIRSGIKAIELLLLGKYDRIAIDVYATVSSETLHQTTYRLAREYFILKHMEQLVDHSATKKQGWLDWGGYKTSRTTAFRLALYEVSKNDWLVIENLCVDNKLSGIKLREQEKVHLKELSQLLTLPIQVGRQ